jgi:O-antigen/teichoic acid export membrane protein
MQRMVAALDARGHATALRRLVARLLLLSTASAGALVLVAFLAAPAIGRLAGETPLSPSLVVLGVLFAMTGALRATIGGVFYGLRDVAPVSIADIAWLGAATLVIALARDSLTPERVLVIESVAQGAVVVGLHVVLWTRALPARGARADSGVVPWREAGDFAGGSLMNSALGAVMENVDKPLVGHAADYDGVAQFHLAGKIVYYGRRLLYLPLSALGPEFTRRWELADRAGAVRDLTLATRLQLLVGLLLWAESAALAQPLVTTLAAARYDTAAMILAVAALALPLSAAYTPAATALRAIGVVWPTVVSDALWTLVFVVGGGLVVATSGLLGLAWVQCAASAAAGAYVLVVARRVLGLRARDLVGGRMLLATAIAYGAMRALAAVVRAPAALEMCLIAPIGALAFWGSVRALRVVHPTERERLAHLLPDGLVRRAAVLVLGRAGGAP